MTGRNGLVALALLALAVASSNAVRTILSVQGGAQYDLDDVRHVHRQLMAGLKTAQEKAGIFVDDAHLFSRPLPQSGRRLQQTQDLGAVFSDPNVLASLLSMLSQGLNVGSFPGAALQLPGGSPFGYAPTDGSYCLFATEPYTGAPAPKPELPFPGGPLPSAEELPSGGVPGSFACVDAEGSPPTTADSFTVAYGGKTYVCQGGERAPPPDTGRRLLQVQPSAEEAIGSALASIGLPLWNCVVATTPAGNTTLGQAAEAILNDLGVIAEHLLVYLNADGQLTYQENVKNNFVSLTNPLYPTGPRLNLSIDFETVTKDVPLFEEIFRTPAPPQPVAATPPGAAVPPTSTTGSGAALTTTPPAGDQSQAGSAGSGAAAAATQAGSPPTAAVATPPSPPPATTTLAAYDGYLDNCQTVIGSAPHGDGNFDRTNNYSSLITDGITNMTTDAANQFAGQVAFVIPASKAVEYSPLTLSTRKSAQFCYDTATLQPVYNPLATFITANASGMAASPASTVVAFGQAYGLTSDAFTQAACIQLPAGQTLETYNALGAAIGGSGQGLSLLKTNVQLANLVTAGANLLTNDTTTYASYAIIIDQSIAKRVVAGQAGGRKLLQTPASSCALDLANATTLASILTIAQQSIPGQADEATRAALLASLTPAQLEAVATATANLNTAVAGATDATTTQLAQYWAETQLAPKIDQLVSGEISAEEFSTSTSPDAVSQYLASEKLPGQLSPSPVLSPSTTVTPVTQSSTTSSGSGLSHGGKVALATVLPIVGVIAIVAAAAYIISRRNSGALDSSNNSAVWWRRPFARSGGSASPIAGSSASV